MLRGVQAVAVVAAITIAGSSVLALADWSDAGIAVAAGVLLLAIFLSLTVSGFFGYGSADASDWIASIPFVVALVVREAFTLHSIDELEVQFATGPISKHSIIYPLFQMIFAPLVRDPQLWTMHVNGVLGAAACLAMYLFVRERTASRVAGFMAALLLAVHPVVSRMAPTDGPQSLLLVTWFSGLALISSPEPNARSLLGGVVLLGVAATTRMEGVLLLVASVVMLDARALRDCVQRHPIPAALSMLVVGTLGALQAHFLLRQHLGAAPLSTWINASQLNMLTDMSQVFSGAYNDRAYLLLIVTAVVAGIVSRCRLGLLGFIAMLIVLLPAVGSADWIVSLHRMVPACALQAMLAGVGAYCVTWIAPRSRWHALTILPGLMAALYMLVAYRADRTTRFVFNEEYDLVRSHLGSPPRSDSGCTLLTFGVSAGDVDIHDYRPVVPDVRVVDCSVNDCLAEAARGDCVFYLRSASCYLHVTGMPTECVGPQANVTGGA